MTDYLQALLVTCMQAKKYGIDCFCDYHTHVNALTLGIYRNGYNSNSDRTFDDWYWICLDEEEELVIKKLKSCIELLEWIIRDKEAENHAI